MKYHVLLNSSTVYPSKTQTTNWQKINWKSDFIYKCQIFPLWRFAAFPFKYFSDLNLFVNNFEFGTVAQTQHSLLQTNRSSYEEKQKLLSVEKLQQIDWHLFTVDHGHPEAHCTVSASGRVELLWVELQACSVDTWLMHIHCMIYGSQGCVHTLWHHLC